MIKLLLMLLSALVRASYGGYVAPVYAWPLGYQLPVTDVISDTTSGNIGDIGYLPGPAVFAYAACKFKGTSSSCVVLRVPDHPDLYGDYSIQFYVRIDDTDGVILDLVSDPVPISRAGDSLITRMTVEVVNSNLKITFEGQNVALQNGGTQYLGQSLTLGVWYHVILERDYSKDKIKTYIDQVTLSDLKVLDKNVPFYLPATVYVGKATDGRYLDCAVACLQIIPSKDPKNEITQYNDVCKASNWPTTTTTSTTPTTTTVPSATTTTTTTTAVPTTESATAAYTTTTTTTSTAPTTTSATSFPSSGLKPSENPKSLIVGCSGFSMSAADSTFASSADVMSSVTVDDVRSCLIFCNKMASCSAFVLTATTGQSTNRTCKVGKNQSPILFENGSTMYSIK